jgi:hypothetical protein
MARFIPYDQTGFGRINPNVGAKWFGSEIKPMDPRLKHKPKDWSTPEGIATALNLTKAIAEHPITDLAVKGIGEAFKGTPDVLYPEKRHEDMLARATDLRVKGGEQNILTAERLEAEARELSGTVVRSMDDLFAFVSRPGATREDLSFAMSKVSNFAPASSLSQIRAGVDPSQPYRKALMSAYQRATRSELTDYQQAMLRLREGNYKSLADKRRDEVTMRRKWFTRRMEGIQSKMDDYKNRTKNRNRKTDADVLKIMGMLALARNEGEVKALAPVFKALVSKYSRTAYPPTVDVVRQYLERFGIDIKLPDPSTIKYPKEKSRRKRGGGGGRRRSSADPGKLAGNLSSILGDYKDELDAVNAAIDATGRDNVTPDQWRAYKATTERVLRILKGYQSSSRVGKGDIRRDKANKVFLISPEDERAVGRVQEFANRLFTLSKARWQGKESGRAEVEKSKTKQTPVQLRRYNNAQEAAGKYGGNIRVFVRGKGGSAKVVVTGLPDSYQSDLDDGDPGAKAFKAALKALKAHVSSHGNLTKKR